MKNVLLLIHDDPGQEARLQVALDLTRALNGHLSCVDVSIVPVMVDDYVPNGGSALLLADEQAREGENRKAIERRLAHEDVAYDWRDVTGDLRGALRDAAGLADVIVVNRQLDGIAFPDMRGLVGDLLACAETPILAVPESARALDLRAKALVAWDGSKAAEEALQAAVPLLALARQVTIVEIDDGSVRVPASEAAQYLSRHGIEPVVRHIPTAFERTSDTLLSEIKASHAAYVVMGGYGHSRMLQAVFGGVTRRMLSESPVPLFLAN
ncbi:universal stress protein [Sphingomonas sp. CJ20]